MAESRNIRLSGVVVCQDNAATIDEVLGSLAPHCDEIVVVDGGSSDDTPHIAAERAGVRVLHREFDGNISRQKNFAFDQCRGSWILLLDTDELLAPEGTWRLPALTRVPFVNWYGLPRVWLVNDQGRVRYLHSKPYHADRQVRLFRNLPAHRYSETRTPIHHGFERPLGPGRPLRTPRIFHYDFLLQSREERERKVERYLKSDPDGAEIHRVYLWEDREIEIRDVPAPLPGMLRRKDRSPTV